MRVIAGKFKSRKLKTLKGDHTRPTSDKIKGAIFSSIGFDVKKDKMLDLFAGSGAMGIEALSRGFNFVYFNDKDKKASKIIKDNLSELNLKALSSVLSLDYKEAISVVAKESSINFVYIDPPYGKIDIEEIISELLEHDILSEKAIVVIESDKSLNLKENYQKLFKYKEKSYGNTKVFYYRKED